MDTLVAVLALGDSKEFVCSPHSLLCFCVLMGGGKWNHRNQTFYKIKFESLYYGVLRLMCNSLYEFGVNENGQIGIYLSFCLYSCDCHLPVMFQHFMLKLVKQNWNLLNKGYCDMNKCYTYLRINLILAVSLHIRI